MTDKLPRRGFLASIAATAGFGWWLLGPVDQPMTSGPTAICRFPDDAPHLMGGFQLSPLKATTHDRLDGELVFANAGGAPADIERELVRYRRDDFTEGRTIATIDERLAPEERYTLTLSLSAPDDAGTWIYDAGTAWAMGSCDLSIDLSWEVEVAD